MFSAFNSLKRKSCVITEERDDDPKECTTNHNSESCIPAKRLRVDKDLSPTIPQQTKKEELRAKLKELQEISVRIKKEAEHHNARLQELMDGNMACMICKDVMQNPQSLSCGHNACYACLRMLWTQPPARNDGGMMIDTDAESDLEEPEAATDDAEGAEPNPRPRRRHIFISTRHRKKNCPYCKKQIIRRPVPNYRLRDVSETLNDHLLSNKKRRSRNDLWHGIFCPENGELANLGPDYFARAREPEEITAQREMERWQAYEEGRRQGILDFQQQRQARAEEARRAAMARPVAPQDLRFGQRNRFFAGHEHAVVIPARRVAAAPLPENLDAPPAGNLPQI